MTKNIDWYSNFINNKEEEIIKKKYIKKGYFGKLKKNNIDSLILSFRKNYIRDLLIRNYYKVFRKIKRIEKEFLNYGILKVSEIYNYPPVAILRLIFKFKKLNKKEINYILRLRKKHKDKFIQKQIEIALENDIVADIDQTNMKKSSLEFEDMVCREFDKYNINYITEDQLREQYSDSGEKFLTPDILLKKPIKINNSEVNWVDAKDFYGANLTTIKFRLQKQSEKYTKAFGKGAFVFRYGVSEDLNIKDTLLLSL